MKKLDLDEITHCPRCPNHCSLDALGCKKGDKFLAKLLEQRAEQSGEQKPEPKKRGLFGRKK